MTKKKIEEEPEKETPSQELQRKYVQLQLLKQYMQAMLEEKGKLEEKLNEVDLTIIAMRKLKEQPKGQEMWSTFGSEVFVMSEIRDMNKVIVGAGAGVFLKKSVEDAITTLEGKKEELDEVNKGLAEESIRLHAEIAKLEPDLQAMADRMQQEQGSAVGG